MKTATVLKLKDALGEYLKSVKAGEDVMITERGRPIARITPVVNSNVFAERLAEMEKQGLIKLGSGKLPKGFWNLPRPKDPKGLVSKAAMQEREQGC
jgi:prevent-host-death family protein